MSNAPTMTLKTSVEKLAKKRYEVEELAREALESRYTIDVMPLGAEDLAAAGLPPVFEVSGRVDGHLLFKIVTRHGGAVAEYLGVKALKAWLNYSGSRRRGKQSHKNHHKRNRANKRARKAAALNPVNPVNPV